MRLEVDVRLRRRAGFVLEARLACETDALGVVGPSGSGKSTLLDAIAGIEPGARVVLDGEDLSAISVHRRGIGLVSADPLLFPHIDVRRNLRFAPGAPSPEALAAALGISSLLGRMPRNLSGGERRRVALARALLARPRLLLLDEPFSGLDEPRRREAMSLLDRARRESGVPVVLVSHRTEEIVGLTERAIRLEAGRIAEEGASASLLRPGETLIDNYFGGTVVGPGRVRVAGAEIAAMLRPGASGEVRLACYAHDLLLASEPPRGLSARNVLPARITSVVPAGEMVLVGLEPPPARALVTPEAVASLALAPGRSAFAVFKATAVVQVSEAA